MLSIQPSSMFSNGLQLDFSLADAVASWTFDGGLHLAFALAAAAAAFAMCFLAAVVSVLRRNTPPKQPPRYPSNKGITCDALNTTMASPGNVTDPSCSTAQINMRGCRQKPNDSHAASMLAV